MSTAEISAADRVAFQFSSFSGLPLTHGMSGRLESEEAEGQVAHARGTEPDVVEANRTAFLTALGIEPEVLTVSRQVHATRIQVVSTKERGRGRYPAFDGFPETDGMVTASPEAALGIIISDCTPILLYDSEQRALGLAHAGWRGTVAGIARELVRAMEREFGSRPDVLFAGIGPSIGPCCYEVGDEVIEEWQDLGIPEYERAIVRGDSRPHFDLWAANELVLLEIGIDASRIERADLCTRCHGDRFFSYRASQAGERPRGSMIMAAQLHRR